jgi:hypothetical protein
MMTAVCRKYDGLATLGHDRSRFALECDMADHIALFVTRNYWNKLAAFDLFPVSAR